MIIKKIYQWWMPLSPLLLCATIFVLIILAGTNVTFDAIDALYAILWTIWSYCAITFAIAIALIAQAAKEIRMEEKIKGEKSNGNEEEHHAR